MAMHPEFYCRGPDFPPQVGPLLLEKRAGAERIA